MSEGITGISHKALEGYISEGIKWVYMSVYILYIHVRVPCSVTQMLGC